MRIKFTPNIQGWMAIAIIIFICLAQQTLIPLIFALAILVVLMPLCICLHFANERANSQIIQELPNESLKKYR